MAFCMFRTKLRMFEKHRCGCVNFSTVQQKVTTVGIDFGCKNSRVAIIDSLVPQVVDSEVGRVTPSYVTFTHLNSHVPCEWGQQHLDCVGKRVEVGEVAKCKMWRRPSDVVYNIKKMIGKQFQDPSIQEMRRRVHFSIIEGSKGEAWVEIHGMEISPFEITTAIFEKLRDMVLVHQFHHELQAVISVPAFFDEQQKEEIKSAAYSAGLKVLRLIKEPIAAALSSTTIEDGVVVVFAMGAGSYSVTILHVDRDRNIEIRAQFSDPSLGGDQFDDILLDHLVKEIFKVHSVDIHGDIYAMTLLAEAAEQAKVKLSSRSEVTISIPFVSASAQGPIDLNVTISRLEFEELADNLIGQIKVKCQTFLKDAEIPVKDIKEMILVGGMAHVPKIQNIISEVFSKNQNTRVNYDEAVVMGSAIQAALIVEAEHEISDDMIPLSVGIESSKGIFTRVIPRHTTVPMKQTVKIPSWCAYGELKCLRILFGEHVMAQHNVPLGEIEVINNKRAPHGSDDLELTFEVDKDYVVNVSTRDADNGSKVFAFPITKKDRSKESIDKAIKKALLDCAMSDIEIHARLRNLARFIMNTLVDSLSARNDVLPKELYDDAVNILADLEKLLDGDVHVLKRKMVAAEDMELVILNWELPSESSDMS